LQALKVCCGVEQDVDQYHTGFAEWKGQLFSRLGVDKARLANGSLVTAALRALNL
jgi:hypothetical protein